MACNPYGRIQKHVSSWPVHSQYLRVHNYAYIISCFTKSVGTSFSCRVPTPPFYLSYTIFFFFFKCIKFIYYRYVFVRFPLSASPHTCTHTYTRTFSSSFCRTDPIMRPTTFIPPDEPLRVCPITWRSVDLRLCDFPLFPHLPVPEHP